MNCCETPNVRCTLTVIVVAAATHNRNAWRSSHSHVKFQKLSRVNPRVNREPT